MRKALDGLYLASGALAAIFLAAIAVVIIIQVVARMRGIAFDSTELSGFFMAASTFLGLAYTFRAGGHVRVSLLVNSMGGARRKMLELWCCVFGAGLSAFVSWNVLLFTLESFEYQDVSPGLMAIPFWIPQAGMSAGMIILTIALLDAAVAVATGRRAGYEENVDTALD